MIERGVVSDPEEPGPQRRHVRCKAECVERLRERVLHDVLTLDDGAREAGAVAVQVGADIGHHGEELLAGGCEGVGGRRHLGLPSARMRLFLALCSTSASPSTSRTGGTYNPKRPRRPFLMPYHPRTGFS